MRRLLLFILFLSLHWASWGQGGYTYKYWFDTDDANTRSGSTAHSAVSFDADISSLTNSLHALHLQIQNEKGEWSSPITRYFIKTGLSGGGLKGYYWLDQNEAATQPLGIESGPTQIDVSSAPNGIHYLHIQWRNELMSASNILTRLFLKMPQKSACRYQYWIDGDMRTLVSGEYTGQPVMLDVTKLSDGLHTIYCQIEEHNQASNPITSLFIKMPQTLNIKDMTCVASIDGKEFHQEKVATSNGFLQWNLDVNKLPHGLHRMQVQAVTPSGVATNVSDHFFFRTTTRAEFADMKLLYTIDGDNSVTQAGKVTNDLYQFELDVANLTNGLHRINYMLTSSNGTSTKTESAFFVKTPIGGNGINKYRYWLNEREDLAHETTLEKRANPFDLITLLPVESMPIRSACFHLEVENGNPIVYAKNDIHFQFFDISGRLLEVCKQFVDYKVANPVDKVAALTSGVPHVSRKPAENEIKWYKLQALTGDSLTVKTDQASTIQIFSPTGKELYVASGASSVEYGGCYALQDGTYFVAVHDVKGTSSDNITLDYQHIDKYAVLSHSPGEVGVVPGIFTLKMHGNGYDKLVSAHLEGPQGEVVNIDSIFVYNKAYAELRVPLKGNEAYGIYKLRLTFKDETEVSELVVEKALVLSSPKYGKIEFEVRSDRKMAMPYPVTVKIKNTGNVCYSLVPINLAYDNVETIQDVAFGNFLLLCSKESVDAGIPFAVSTNNLFGRGIKGRMFNLMLLELAAQEEVELELAFTAPGHTHFNVYAWADRPWSLTTQESMLHASYNQILKAPVTTECMPDPCEMSSQFITNLQECACGNVMGQAQALGNFYAALQRRNNLEAIKNCGYSSYEELRDALGIEMDMFSNRRLHNPSDIFWGALQHCLPDGISEVADFLRGLREHQVQDPCPNPEPSDHEVLVPGDPNDMIGYTSEAGSKFMRKEITDLFYKIEFENDPKLASASAHTIVVKDTLDATHFDLASFAATGVKIGEVEMKVSGEKRFIRTMDLRPSINVIAEVQLEYAEKQGIATWTIRSLDPMTMEPTDDPMQGALPININGNGQGEFSFDISLKKSLEHGDSICNRASIVFDREAAIITPTWTNKVDDVAPQSKLTGFAMVGTDSVSFTKEATDDYAGPWAYDLFAQKGPNGEWKKVAATVAVDSVLKVYLPDGADYGFCIVLTDSAGNVEQKAFVREVSVAAYKPGDVNNDKIVNATDAVLTTRKYLGEEAELNTTSADMNHDGKINAADVVLIQNLYVTEVLKNNTFKIKRKR